MRDSPQHREAEPSPIGADRRRRLTGDEGNTETEMAVAVALTVLFVVTVSLIIYRLAPLW